MVKLIQKHTDDAKKILHCLSEPKLLHKAQELADNEAEQSEIISAKRSTN